MLVQSAPRAASLSKSIIIEPMECHTNAVREQHRVARQMRAYLSDKKGRIAPEVYGQYKTVLNQHGEALNWKDAKEITVKDLEARESDLMARSSESTVSTKMTILRGFLMHVGNVHAKQYRKICSLRPASDSVFFTEDQIARCRLAARSVSNYYELVFSWMVDDGLRPVDVIRLTVDNAREFLSSGESVILGKGRNGGKKAKLVISPLTLAPLKRYLAQRRTMEDSDQFELLMLVKYHGRTKSVTRFGLYQMMQTVFVKAGMMASPRDLRKTCGNRVYKLTRDIAMAAMILRHSSPNVTFQHYIGADSVEMSEVQARLAALNPEPSSQSA